MKCDSKTILKAAAGVGIALAIAYFTLPAARAFILAIAPIMLVLVCPLSMLFMMKAMNDGSKRNDDARSTEDKVPPVAGDKPSLPPEIHPPSPSGDMPSHAAEH